MKRYRRILPALAVAALGLFLAGPALAAVAFNPDPPPDGRVGVAYGDITVTTDGVALADLVITPGLGFTQERDAAGVIRVVAPAPVLTTAGTLTITAQEVDGADPPAAVGDPVSRTIAIHPAVTLSPAALELPRGTEGADYGVNLNNEFTAVTPPGFNWSSPGPLPAGLSLAADGNLTGVPEAVGTFNFNVTYTDPREPAGSASAALSLEILAAASPFLGEGAILYTEGTARNPANRGTMDDITATGDLVLRDLVTNQSYALATGFELVLNPAFTPEGTKVVFTASPGDAAYFRVYLTPIPAAVAIDGALAANVAGKVLLADIDARYAALSPDFDDSEPDNDGRHPGKLAYVRATGTSGLGLWVKSFATGRANWIVDEPGLTIRHPVFVDEDNIAFVGRKNNIENIWLIPAVGGTRVNLTQNTTANVRYSRVLSAARQPGMAPRVIYSKTTYQAYAWRPWNVYSRAVTDIGQTAEVALTDTTADELAPAFYGDTGSVPVLAEAGLMLYEADLLDGDVNIWKAPFDLAGLSNQAREGLSEGVLDGQVNWGPVAVVTEPEEMLEAPIPLADSRLFWVRVGGDGLISADGDAWSPLRGLELGENVSLLRNPTVSGTGGTVVVEYEYAPGETILMRLNHDASHVEALAGLDAGVGQYPIQPSLSYDGRFMLYVSADNADDKGALWVTSPAAPGGAVLLAGDDIQDPSFNPQMTQVVFRRASDVGEEGIYTLRVNVDREAGTIAALGAPVKLTETLQGVWNRQPVFTPDGRHILFVSNRWSQDFLPGIFAIDATRGEVGGGKGARYIATGIYPVFGPVTADPNHWFLAFNSGTDIVLGRVNRADPQALLGLEEGVAVVGDATEGKFAWGYRRTAGSIVARRDLQSRVPAGAAMEYLIDVHLDRGRVPDGFVVQDILPIGLLDTGVPIDVEINGAAHTPSVVTEDGDRALRVAFSSTGVGGFVIDPLVDTYLVRVTLGTDAGADGFHYLTGRVDYTWNQVNTSTAITGNRRLQIGNPHLPVDIYNAQGLAREDGDPKVIGNFDLMFAINAWKTDARLRGPLGLWPADVNSWNGLILAVINIWAQDQGEQGWMGDGVLEAQVADASDQAGEYVYIPGAGGYVAGFLYQPDTGLAPVPEMYWTYGQWQD